MKRAKTLNLLQVETPDSNVDWKATIKRQAERNFSLKAGIDELKSNPKNESNCDFFEPEK